MTRAPAQCKNISAFKPNFRGYDYCMSHSIQYKNCENFRISVGNKSRFGRLPCLLNENYSQTSNFYENVSQEQVHI